MVAAHELKTSGQFGNDSTYKQTYLLRVRHGWVSGEVARKHGSEGVSEGIAANKFKAEERHHKLLHPRQTSLGEMDSRRMQH